MVLKKIFAGMLAVGFAGSAAADHIDTTDLVNGLNAASQDGAFNLDPIDDQYNPDEIWTLDAASNGTAVYMFQFSDMMGDGTFGIYQLGNSDNRLELFDSDAEGGYRTTLTFVGGNYVANYFDSNGMFMGSDQLNLGDQHFGFYLSSGENTFFSQESENEDGYDHMLAWQGDNEEMLDPDGDGFYGLFTANNFILAWENSMISEGESYNFADLVVYVESFVPVPAPATLAVLGLGLLGLGAARRRA